MSTPPIKRVIYVHCDECDRTYEIDLVKGIKAQGRIIDYSICTHCSAKRRESLHHIAQTFMKAKQCSTCHVPDKELRNGLCRLHYMRSLREQKSQKKRI